MASTQGNAKSPDSAGLHCCSVCGIRGHNKTTCPQTVGDLTTVPRWKRYHLRRRAEGKCIQCGKRRGAKGGAQRCRRCMDIVNLASRNNPNINKAVRAKRQRQIKEGLCWCGSEAYPERTMCAVHLHEMREKERKRKRRRAGRPLAARHCSLCGVKGHTIRSCEQHATATRAGS